MAINQLIAKKYARGAFDLAKKSNLIDQFSGDLKKISEFFTSNIIKEISNPAISKADLQKIIIEICEKLSVHSQVASFLVVVAGARRISEIVAIENYFSKLSKIEKKILEVEVVSTTNLSDEILKEVKSSLEKQNVGLEIEIKQTIKKDILGGLVIKIGSNMIDASLKSQLDSLKVVLNESIGQAA